MPDSTPTSDPSKPRNFVDVKNTFWVWLIERLGLPTILVGVGIYAADKTAKWIAPRIDEVTTKHMEFMDKTEDMQRQSLDLQKQNLGLHKDQSVILERVTRSQEGTSLVTDEHRRLTLEIRDDVRDIKGAVMTRGARP